MVVKQIVFDLGGVLIEWDPQSIVERFTSDRSLQGKLLLNIFLHSDWLELDRGTINEVQAAKKIAVRANLPEKVIHSVFASVRESLSAIENTVQLLNSLVEQGIHCYGLSNISVENYQYLKQTHDFFESFSGIIISGYEKTIKPEIPIYQLLSERYQLIPAETLLIDDTLDNCVMAKMMGMEALHFKRDQISYIDIHQYLLPTSK